MNLIKRKPTTPSQRHRITIDKSSLTKIKPIKSLTRGLTKKGGRNNHGRITVFTKGGGNKRKYRLIDFKRNLLNIPAIVKRLEYDPNRSAFIALIYYTNGILSYILAPLDLKVGDIIITSTNINTEIKIGNTLPLKNIPIGTLLHNVELKPGKGGQLARAAGTYVQLIKKDIDGYAMIRLISGEHRIISLNCFATIGKVSNLDNKNKVLGKAGASRWIGRRPIVRGVAMNPVDHPHGGGEGKTSGGRPSVTPWGKHTKGKPTRNKKRNNKFIIKKK